MRNTTALQDVIVTGSYGTNFINSLRDRSYDAEIVDRGRIPGAETYALPKSLKNKYESALLKESLMRKHATVIHTSAGTHGILARDCDDIAEWVDEGQSISVYDAMDDFTKNTLDYNKLTSFIRIDRPFAHDATFDFDDYLVKRFARAFGKAEDKAFITGTGVKEPAGLTCPGKGAELAVVTDSITFDDVYKLYFSLDREYRDKAVWLMNDETAFNLRSMKDDAGNYLWNQMNDTILGKPVLISNYMPSEESGTTPILFGDLSYYWIVCRQPVSIRALYERFAVYDQIGYLGVEYLDGRLIRREAVQGIAINATDANVTG